MSCRDALRLLLLAFAAATGLALWAVGLGLHGGNYSHTLLAALAGVVGAHLHEFGRSRAMDRIVTATEGLSLLALIGATGAIASYAVAAATTGYVDAILAHADAALGLDWIAYWRLIHASPVALTILAGYASILVTPALLVLALTLSGSGEVAHRFLLAFTVALALTNIVFIVTPARAAAAYHLGLHAPFLTAVHKEHVAVIEALRARQLTQVPLDRMIGLITFPSFHATAAILCIWGAWSRPWLRLPSLAINIAMLLSTPVQGSHYFVDVAGGMLVAAASIAVTEIARRKERPVMPHRRKPPLAPILARIRVTSRGGALIERTTLHPNSNRDWRTNESI